MRILCVTGFASRPDSAIGRAEWLAARTAGYVTLVKATRRDSDALALIVDAAHLRRADLIVLKPPQAHPLDSLIGTPAERLMRRTGVPVLAVRGGSAGGYDHAVVAAGLTAASGAMLRTATEVLGLARSKATLLHALKGSHDGRSRLASLEPASLEAYLRAFEEKARVALRQLARQAGLPLETSRVEVRRQPAIKAILDLLHRDRPGLLAVGANPKFTLKRLTLGSVADQALRGAPCDVLVIPQRRLEPDVGGGLRAGAARLVAVPPPVLA